MALQYPNYSTNILLSLYSEESIFKFYFGDFEYKKLYASPFRQENTPSFNIFLSSNGENKVLFKDFGNGWTGNCFKFVSYLYHINYYQAIVRIYKDMNFNYKEDISKIDTCPVNYSSIFRVEMANWNDNNIEFWKQYNINNKMLKFYNIYPVNRLYKNHQLVAFYTKENPIFNYDFNNNFKIYKPESKPKFFKLFSKFIVEGGKQYKILRKYDSRFNSKRLIITKSLKDVMVFTSMYKPSIAFNSENYIPDENFLELLIKNFNEIYILYDNDSSGIHNSNILLKEFNKCIEKTDIKSVVNNIIIPKSYDSKDISDMIKNHGYDRTYKTFKNL